MGSEIKNEDAYSELNRGEIQNKCLYLRRNNGLILNEMRNKITLLFAIALMSSGIYAQKISGTWNGKLNAGQQTLSLVFHFSQDTAGKDVCTLDCPEQNLKGFPAEVAYIAADSVNIHIPSLGASYAGAFQQGEVRGKFLQSGMSFDVNLTAGEVEVIRSQNPQPPFPYHTEEVTFTNTSDHASFAGTLTYPVGYEKMQKSTVAVVLMVTGSGQENRDEELFQHRPFLVIADYLARHGIATLRYDDRGVGGSKGDLSKLTTRINMEDAAAGISYLRKLRQFGHVGVLGHSEGGTVAFMLAARGLADFIVSMAGSAVGGDSVISEQVHRACALNGIPRSMADGQIANIRKMNNPWLKFFLTFDPSSDIQGAKCPVMAINGSKDIQVISASNLTTIRRLLPPTKTNLVKEYADLNHLFQHCTTGNTTEYVNISETISPDVLKDLSEWIRRVNQ